MKSSDIRRKFIEFYKKHGHVEIPSDPLLPQNDPSTLFTSSGMQPLIPYLLGQSHPSGKRLVNSQKSFRAQDIDEVGDNRHTTFFEMLGNWSLGDYFKKEQLPWIWEFLTKELGLNPGLLYVSVFEGSESVSKDEESVNIWKSLGVPENHIYYYGVKKNWWSRSGEPGNMPPDEPGGPDSEVFFDFGTPHDPSFGAVCHPNCDCGRFMEIANSVFMQYKKLEDGKLEEMAQRNVDFGGGLERMCAAANNNPDVFATDLFSEIIKATEEFVGVFYSEDTNKKSMRIIADHLKAATFMINEKLIPSNKQQGYILRRLIRRAVVKMHSLGADGLYGDFGKKVYQTVGVIYDGVYFDKNSKDFLNNQIVLTEEINRFEKVLHKGINELHRHDQITGKVAFDLLQSFGIPWEITYEQAVEKGQDPDKNEFEDEFKKHQNLSRTAAKGMFKGGLADHSQETTRLHTAHHLLLAALQKIVDPGIKQRGSNITSKRLRMDFNYDHKISASDIKKIEDLVNQKIKENIKVERYEMSRSDAEKIGAQMEFGHKYPDRVSVYFIGRKQDYFSAEFCGGPHVDFTGELGHFTIDKDETLGAGIRRMYARLI